MTNDFYSGTYMAALQQSGILKLFCKNTNRALFWGGEIVLQ